MTGPLAGPLTGWPGPEVVWPWPDSQSPQKPSGRTTAFRLSRQRRRPSKPSTNTKGLCFVEPTTLKNWPKGLEDNEVEIPEIVKESVILAKYASETRYPGTYEPVSQEEYQKAVRIAQAVVDWAESLILG